MFNAAKFTPRAFILFSLLLCPPSYSRENGKSNLTKRLEKSIEVLRANNSIPEKAIPESVLKNAKGIAVIPNVVKGAFILGGRYGKGVVTKKINDTTWSYPAFVTIEGGSIGWQWGVENVDLVLVFKSRKGVDSLLSGKITFGAGVSATAGPVGRHAEASTNSQFNAEVYSYVRSRGLFLGASLEGTTLRVDKTADHEFYQSFSVDQKKILENSINDVPSEAVTFRQDVERVSGVTKK
jgi:lipid-binding SYLF domain-containing protein